MDAIEFVEKLSRLTSENSLENFSFIPVSEDENVVSIVAGTTNIKNTTSVDGELLNDLYELFEPRKYNDIEVYATPDDLYSNEGECALIIEIKVDKVNDVFL